MFRQLVLSRSKDAIERAVEELPTEAIHDKPASVLIVLRVLQDILGLYVMSQMEQISKSR